MLRSTVTAVRPLRTRETVARATPIRRASSVVVVLPRNYFNSSPGLAGLYIIVMFAASSVIIPIINRNRVLSLKTECEPPVLVDCDCPVTLKVPFERVPVPTRPVHILRHRGQIQSREQDAKARFVRRLNSRLRTYLEKSFQTAMPEGFNHFSYCNITCYTPAR